MNGRRSAIGAILAAGIALGWAGLAASHRASTPDSIAEATTAALSEMATSGHHEPPLPLAAGATRGAGTVRAVGAARAARTAAPGGAAEQAPAGPEAAARLVGRAVGATPLIDNLRELCDRIGGRPTGSPACERAIAWGERTFRDAGISSVSLEPFTVPVLWLPESAEAACLAPASFPLRVVSAPYSPSTPGGKALEARLVDAGSGQAEDFIRLGESARGAIALVSRAEMKTIEDLFVEYLEQAPMLDAARKAGVSALLLQSSRPRGLLYRHPASVTATMAPVPVALVSREQAARLSRLAADGEVRIRLALVNRTGGPYESRNVIAEIRGREAPQEIVLLGAHLDSWDLGTGAEDNGVNVALVIDVARGMRELGLVPRRTIRFALFTGEEQGLWGSAGYVRRHANELGNHVAAVVFDIGSGRTTGFYLNGREELRAPVERALAAVSGLSASEHSIEGIDGTDNFDFLLSGVPNLVGAQDPQHYLPDYHAESDTFERVNAREARTNAAVAAALVWGLAESPERPARRQSRHEVEKLLVETKLDEQMKAFRQWDDWVAGKRGVSQ